MAKIDRSYHEPQQSLHGKVYELLESNIINGVYKPGDCLSEPKLSEEFGVSRTPIREGITPVRA